MLDRTNLPLTQRYKQKETQVTKSRKAESTKSDGLVINLKPYYRGLTFSFVPFLFDALMAGEKIRPPWSKKL